MISITSVTHFDLLLAYSFILYIFNNASPCTEYDLRGCKEEGGR